MNCICSICCAPLEKSDDIFVTQCGHIFHFPCLTQWLERSNTCPHCRDKTTKSKIQRLYFTFSNNESIREDASSLQEKNDNLKFQILLKEKDLSNAITDMAKYKKHASGLKKEVLKLEQEMRQKDSAIHALKEQNRYFKGIADETVKYRDEAKQLRTKINDYKDIQALLSASTDDTDDIIATTSDPKKLGVYICALTRQIKVGMNERKTHKLTIKQYAVDLRKALMEVDSLKNELRNKRSLEEKYEKIQQENSELRRKSDSNSRIRNDSDVIEISDSATSVISIPDSPSKSVPPRKNRMMRSQSQSSGSEDEENSFTRRVSNTPFPQVSGMDTKRKFQRTSSNLSSSSILMKKPRLAQNSMARTGPVDERFTSDGLGGFTKIDSFPISSGGRKGIAPPKRSRKI